MHCVHESRVNDACCYDGTIDSLKEFQRKYSGVAVENVFDKDGNIQEGMVKFHIPNGHGRSKFLLKIGDYIIHGRGTRYFQFISKEEFNKHYLIVEGVNNGKYENQLDHELQKSTASGECSGGDRQGRYGFVKRFGVAVGPIA